LQRVEEDRLRRRRRDTGIQAREGRAPRGARARRGRAARTAAMTRRAALLAGLALALLLSPAAAQASTASVSTVAVQMFEPHTGDFTVNESTFTYTAAGGEVNAPLFA